MAASSLLISQESFSVKVRIFSAERKWAYSFTSSRPSQTLLFPWWGDQTGENRVNAGSAAQPRSPTRSWYAVPWSGTCIRQPSPVRGSSFGPLAFPSACSRRCDSFSPGVPGCQSTYVLLLSNRTRSVLCRQHTKGPNLAAHSGLFQ